MAAAPTPKPQECDKCALLLELYKASDEQPRTYWVMTELFVMLHGADVCNALR